MSIIRFSEGDFYIYATHSGAACPAHIPRPQVSGPFLGWPRSVRRRLLRAPPVGGRLSFAPSPAALSSAFALPAAGRAKR